MRRHTKLKVTVLTLAATLMFAAAAQALSGTYVVLTKGGGGLALFFTEKGTFTSVALNGRTKRKHYGKGKYTVAGNNLTIKTSNGVTGTITIEPNGDLYDKATNLRLHRYTPRKKRASSQRIGVQRTASFARLDGMVR
jgi:hypothetical protein